MLLVPYSIVRLLDISGFAVSFEAIVFAYVCWFSLGTTISFLIDCPDDWPGVVDILLIYNTFRILGPVLLRPSAMTDKALSSLQIFECLTPSVSTTSRNEKISQHRNSDLSSRLGSQSMTEACSKSLVLNSSPSNRNQSLTMPLSSPASECNVTITPPPSASLSSRSENGRRDRENSPLLAAGIPAPRSRFTISLPQSLGIYGGFVPINGHEIVRQHSTRTVECQNPSRSRITSWLEWTTDSPRRPYLMLPKANEGQARLGV